MFGPHVGKAMVLGGVAASLIVGCGKGSTASPGTGGSAAGAGGASAAGNGGAVGAAGISGAAGTPIDAGGDAPADDGGSAAGVCAQAPVPRRSTGTILELPFEAVFEGQPFVYGEANTVAPGQSVIPTNFRFYVSEVALIEPGNRSIAVDAVSASRGVLPYGVFLFNAESADAQTLRVLAPPGSYDGLSFVLGLTPACNQGSAAGRVFPLSADSQMTWPIPIGYLFLRYESVVTGAVDAGDGARVPRAIHMGGDIRNLNVPGGISVRVDGALSVPADGSVRKVVRVAMDQIFAGATSDVDLTGFPFAADADEIADGERLRRSGAGLPLFTFAP
jgi:hypothetical protein